MGNPPKLAAAPHILAVDDDPALRAMIADYLAEQGLRVSTAADGAEMARVLADAAIDLIVLDLKLPGEDGLTLARRLRADSNIPIIMLTGQNDPIDRVVGLEIGADDYLTKPFSPRELLARIKAVLRRAQALEATPLPTEEHKAYRFAGWELNLRSRRLTTPDGQPMELTNGEFNLLMAFLKAPQRVLSRDHLLEYSRLHSDEVFDRSIDTQILRLRRKLEANPSEPQIIKTERGAGYVFAVPVGVL
ncbi:MAG: response regulator [Gammaproteobacteria bacterium]